MKTLTISSQDSVFTYPHVYDEYEYDVNMNSSEHLRVNKRDSITGQSFVVAHFKNWDYFIIDEDND